MDSLEKTLLAATSPQEVYPLFKHHLVPTHADWCEIHLSRPDGSSELVAALHRDEKKTNVILERFREFPPNPEAKLGLAPVLNTGVPERVEQIPEILLAALFPETDELAIIHTLGYTSTLILPLKVEERLLGAVLLVRTDATHGFKETDVETLEPLFNTTAVVLEKLLRLQLAEKQVSNSRRNERIAKAGQLRYKRWLEANPVSTMVLSADGYTLEVNRAFQEFWGISIEKDVAFNVSLFNDPQLQAMGALAFFERALKGETIAGPPTFYDTRFDAAGQARYFRHKIAPIPSASGKVREIVVVHLELSPEEKTDADKRLISLGVSLPADLIKRTKGLLSPRELGVLRLIAEGMSNKEIARTLSISENTAKFHVTSLFNKLGAMSRAQAVTMAVQQGLL